MNLNPKLQITNPKQIPMSNDRNPKKIWLFEIRYSVLFVICILYIGILSCFAQDNNKLVTLSKQIIEAKTNQDAYVALGELADLYFNENKYTEYIAYLNSLVKQKKILEPVVNYYIGFTRYCQLKHLEQIQNWDEYFARGNSYRDEIVASLQKTIASVAATDALGVYARLALWKFHKEQNDAAGDTALSDLMNSALAYAKDAKDLKPIKDAADEFSSYGEKAKAKELYKLYVDRIVASDIKDDELKTIALSFYEGGNLDLAEAIYDVYLERAAKEVPKEKLIPVFTEIARSFAYRDEGPADMLYAEKIFTKIEEAGGKEAFDEELIYLRAFNLEKAKEYQQAKDFYLDLVQRYPQSARADEANFKAGLIHTYILRDIKSGRIYFEKLAQKETISPPVISSLYQLGLLSQWEEDLVKAKEYYNKLLERSKASFPETENLAKERLKEIEGAKPIEYNLKTFLDVSFKEEYAMLDMSKLDLRSRPYKAKKDTEINISSTAYTAQSGCLAVELQYLWSGHLGNNKPTNEQISFATQYIQTGTKEINLVVVSATGIIDRNIELADVY